MTNTTQPFYYLIVINHRNCNYAFKGSLNPREYNGSVVFSVAGSVMYKPAALSTALTSDFKWTKSCRGFHGNKKSGGEGGINWPAAVITSIHTLDGARCVVPE